MSKTDKGLPGADDAPLSDEVLKAIVGGTRSEEAKPMDGERAAALTAGAEAGGFVDVAHHGFLPPGGHGPGTAMKAGASESAAPTAQADGSVTGLKAGASGEASSGFMTKAGGQGPEAVKSAITVERVDGGLQALSASPNIKVAAPGAGSAVLLAGDMLMKSGQLDHAASTPHAEGAKTGSAPTAQAEGSLAGLKAGASGEATSGFMTKAGGQGPEAAKSAITVERVDGGLQALSASPNIKVAVPGAESAVLLAGDMLMKSGPLDHAASTPHAEKAVSHSADPRAESEAKVGVSAEFGSGLITKTGGQGSEADKGAVHIEQITPGFQAQSGPPTIKVAADGATSGSAAETLATLDPDKIKEILADFRGIHGVKLTPGIETSKTYAGKSTEKDLANSADEWKTTTKSTALDQQKAAEKAAAEAASKAQDTHLANLLAKTEEGRSQTAAQDGVKTAEQNVKTSFDQLVKAQQSVLKDGGDAVQHAQKLASLAQDIHSLNTQTVKDTEASYKNAIQADKPAHEVKKAEDAYRAALLDQQSSQKQLATYKDDLSKKVADKVQDKTTDLKKADDALAKARSDAGDETRPRANSAPTGSGTEKPAADPVKSTGDAPSGHDVNAQIDKALREAQAAKAKAEAEKKAEDAAKDKAKKDAELRQKITGFAVSAADQAFTEAAKADAKERGTYSKTTTTDVTHGGVESETHEADGVKVTTNTLHQTTLKHGVESWDSELGYGKNGVWAPKAEAGYETVTEFTDASGDKRIVKDSAYASAEFENKAGYSVTDAAVNAEASSKIVGHAEIKHSETSTVLGLEVTTEKSLAAHGEAGVKAGAHLGFDGLKVEAAAKAEATASATGSHEAKIGEGSAKVSADVFVQAKAEAKAGADVTFDPLAGKITAKIGASAEAGVGVGADAEGSLKSKDGNGVTVGAHVKAGTVGGTFEPEVKIENGKVDIKLKIGGYVGIGGTFDVAITGDYKKAGERFDGAVKDLIGYSEHNGQINIDTSPVRGAINVIVGTPYTMFKTFQGLFS
jgi:hypothetical protein